jgi:beta-lactam-binding protein with PASTA domain
VGVETAVIPTELVGEDVDKAEKRLEEAGFTNVGTEQADDEPSDADKDDVLSVDPGEGTSLALDKKITLFYASGRDDSGPRQQRETSTPDRPESESAEPSPSETDETTEPPDTDESSATQSATPEASESESAAASESSRPDRSTSTRTPTTPQQEKPQQEEKKEEKDTEDVAP